MTHLRILILSDPIEPPSYAPRVTSLFRFLKEAGYDVVLESGQKTEKQSRLAFFADKLWGRNDRQFGKMLQRKYPQGRFDIILCSTYYYFPLRTACYLSQLWQIPYVVDLRDIVEQWGTSFYFTTPLPHLGGLERIIARWYERKNIRLRNQIMQSAKAVITVSPWHQQYLQSLTQTPVHLVYNGFDATEIKFDAITTQVFSIAYIGRFIKLHLRQPQLLFQAVGELLRKEKIDNLSLDFYSEPDKEQDVRALATQSGVDEYVHWHTFIDRTELSTTMAQSSVLVALGCAPQYGQHGILGTKVFEAIGAEKPLLSVPSDEDSLAALIQETGIGIAATSSQEIADFIEEKYQEWKAKGYTRQTVSDKERFSRQEEAKLIEKILL